MREHKSQDKTFLGDTVHLINYSVVASECDQRIASFPLDLDKDMIGNRCKSTRAEDVWVYGSTSRMFFSSKVLA